MTVITSDTRLTLARWSSDRPEDRFDVHDPATGHLITTVQGGGAAEVDLAVRAANSAFPSWSRRTSLERSRLLFAAAAVIREHADELGALESRENGKPYSQARNNDVESCIAIFELFGRLATQAPSTASRNGVTYDVTMLRPYGVIGAIIPFNWPPIHTAGKLAPALAVGNVVVVKPPEQAPLTIMRIIELVQSVFPEDVIQVVPGAGAAGVALAGHPLVRKLSFTGAPTTGVSVLKTAAENLTPTLMELGGKNPFIIFDDANIDLAVRTALEGGWYNQGEACTAASRIIVQRGVHDEVVAKLSAAVDRLVVGKGSDPRTHIGPLVTRAQQERVKNYIEIGIQEGALIAATAPLPSDPELVDGFFVQPTLLTNVTSSMRVAKEEIFGPVVTVSVFDTEEEAIAIADGTEFGLVGAVFTSDAERAQRVSYSVEAGIFFINNYRRMSPGSPFGGTKHSGYGREHAAETLHEFGYTKTIRALTGDGSPTPWDAISQVFRPTES